VSRLHLEGPSGESVVLTSPTPTVLLVRRCEFDDLLVRLAVDAGTALEEEAWVSTVRADEDGVSAATRDGRTFAARFLVAADGVNGVTARRLGLSDGWDAGRLALDMMEETPNAALRAVEPGTLWVSYGHGGTDGYGYIFPKRDHVNVGIGCLLSYFREHMRLAPYDLQRQFVDSLRGRGVLEGASSREHFTPAHIPVAGPIRQTARGRVLVAGDAGGFVNAYTAEGIYYAMVSGELAGRSIAATLAAPDPAEADEAARRYVRSWKAEIGGELRDSVLIQKYLFRESRRIGAVVRGAAEYREIADLIIAYAMGTISYHEARRRVLTRFPRVAWRLARIYFLSR
jgi:flavin-dependent dehydrogenase